MEEYFDLAVKLPKEIYDYVMERGFMEVCTRDVDKKFQVFQKCLINEKAQQAEKQLAEKILSNPATNVKDLRKFARKLGKNMDQLAQGISANADMLQNMSCSMESMMKGISRLGKLEWLNVGLSVVNLGATVVGFAVMYKKLDAMSSQISQLQCSIDQIKAINIQFNIVKEYEILRADTKIYFSNIANNHEVAHDSVEELIKRYGIFINNLLKLVEMVSTDQLIQIIYNVLPVFSQLIISYYENYYGYYEDKRNPLHSDWMQIFDQVNGDAFRNILRDYYFIDCGLSNAEVNTILDGQFVLNCEMISQINDTLTILDAVGSVEKYKEIKAATNLAVAEMAQEYLPTLKEVYGEDEAIAILRDTLKDSIGYVAVA